MINHHQTIIWGLFVPTTLAILSSSTRKVFDLVLFYGTLQGFFLGLPIWNGNMSFIQICVSYHLVVHWFFLGEIFRIFWVWNPTDFGCFWRGRFTYFWINIFFIHISRMSLLLCPCWEDAYHCFFNVPAPMLKKNKTQIQAMKNELFFGFQTGMECLDSYIWLQPPLKSHGLSQPPSKVLHELLCRLMIWKSTFLVAICPRFIFFQASELY